MPHSISTILDQCFGFLYCLEVDNGMLKFSASFQIANTHGQVLKSTLKLLSAIEGNGSFRVLQKVKLNICFY